MLKDKEKHIWKCTNCGARIKALYGIIPKPNSCPNCNNKNFN